MPTCVERVAVIKHASTDLSTRASATSFFDSIESLDSLDVEVDFKGVKTITRSFAHEYIERKKASRTRVSEINVPVNVQKMFDVVNEQGEKHKVVDMSKVKVVTL